jgi:hypothetical protein
MMFTSDSMHGQQPPLSPQAGDSSPTGVPGTGSAYATGYTPTSFDAPTGAYGARVSPEEFYGS